MNQESQDGRKKTMMFNLCQNRYKDDRRKSVTPAVIRLEVQMIITDINLSTSKSYYYQLCLCRRLTAKESEFYVLQHLLTYLCSSTNSYLILVHRSKLTTSRKLVIKVTETRLLIMSRITTYHKPRLCLMLIIREPHFHLTFKFKF